MLRINLLTKDLKYEIQLIRIIYDPAPDGYNFLVPSCASDKSFSSITAGTKQKSIIVSLGIP